jgi:hypothetical protein
MLCVMIRLISCVHAVCCRIALLLLKRKTINLIDKKKKYSKGQFLLIKVALLTILQSSPLKFNQYLKIIGLGYVK